MFAISLLRKLSCKAAFRSSPMQAEDVSADNRYAELQFIYI